MTAQTVLQRTLYDGILADYEMPDEIHVSKNDAKLVGRWGIVFTGLMVAPFRIKGRSKNHDFYNRVHFGNDINAINVSYGVRSELGLNLKNANFSVEPGRSLWGNYLRLPIHKFVYRKAKHFLELWFCKIGERLFGNPPYALRAVEGLAGDDSEMVVRVDESVLDYIGITSGDLAFLSWGKRCVKVRVLIQSDITRERMDAQLSESLYQVRGKNNHLLIEGRQTIPKHLMVWVSAKVRNRLNIPTDTIVRLRRHPWKVFWKRLPDLSMPVVSVILAAVALKELDIWWILPMSIAYCLVILLSLISDLRIKRRK